MKEFGNRNEQFNQRAWNPQPDVWGALEARTAAEASLSERMSFVRKVYALFFAATLFAVGGVALGFVYPPLRMAVAAHPWISLFALLGGVVGAQAVRHVPGVNLVALFAFTTLTGASSRRPLPYAGSTRPRSSGGATVASSRTDACLITTRLQLMRGCETGLRHGAARRRTSRGVRRSSSPSPRRAVLFSAVLYATSTHSAHPDEVRAARFALPRRLQHLPRAAPTAQRRQQELTEPGARAITKRRGVHS